MGIEVYADLNREQEKRKKCVEGSLRCKEHLRKSQAKKKKRPWRVKKCMRKHGYL